MAQEGVEAGDGGAVRGVDGDPGGVAHDVEAGVGGLPLLGEAGAQQAVDLHPAVEFLAEVLAAGVGDAQTQGELEHRGGARAVDGADGGGGVPGVTEGAQVVEEAGIEQGCDGGALEEFAGLPGVEGQGVKPSGRGIPGASRPRSRAAETGRPRSVQAESVARADGAIANQCRGRSRGVRVSSGGPRLRRGLRGSSGRAGVGGRGGGTARR